MNHTLHCTYITMYTGSKLPKWYIGKSTVQKVNNGYNGSVCSKKYKSIYNSEQTLNKHLFKTRILSTFLTSEEALTEELRLQKMHKVLKNPNYINMAYASKNGFFGMDNSGENHPMFGKSHSEESCKNISNGCIGRTSGNKGKTGSIPWNKGKTGVQICTEKTKLKIKATSLKNKKNKGEGNPAHNKVYCYHKLDLNMKLTVTPDAYKNNSDLIMKISNKYKELIKYYK